jgi:hypothetical protein
MKNILVGSLKSSVRLWFAVLLISAGFVCAVWAVAPGGSGGTGIKTYDDCWNSLGSCNNKCTRMFRYPGSNGLARQECYGNCEDAYSACMQKAGPATAGAGTTGQSQPPNKQGPNSTPTPAPTPRRYPIKGPPHKLGPSPTPSPKPILLAKPKSTPTPKPTPKKSGHGHH